MSEVHPELLPNGLFGCFHLPSRSGSAAVLLVAPLFGEYIQHHRCYYVLAETLAAAGLPTLRFDHAGTGDSPGDLDDVTVAQWTDDIGFLARELTARTGARTIYLAGARMGATLALVAAPRIARTAGLVLWEPIRSPREHLDELVECHRAVLGGVLGQPGADLPRPDGTWDVLGFRIGNRLWSDLGALEPDPYLLPDALDVAVLTSRPAPEWSPPEGYERWSRLTVPQPHGWLDPEDGIYDVLVPNAAVESITRWIGERA